MQKDSWAVDYQATKNVLEAARQKKAKHFVLLSAICVQKPLLEFQRAKLRLEAELQAADDISYSIVRPTAFFKSLAAQVQLQMMANPFLKYGLQPHSRGCIFPVSSPVQSAAPGCAP